MLHRVILSGLDRPNKKGQWWRALAVYAFALIAAMLCVSFRWSQISDNRVLNEIAGNGDYSFIYALSTNELDYTAYYACIDPTEASRRVRRLVHSESDAGTEISPVAQQ